MSGPTYTRAGLATDVMGILRRTNLNGPVLGYDAIGTAIAMAQEEINNTLRSSEMVTIVTLPILGQYVPLPADFLVADEQGVRCPGFGEMFAQTPSFLADIQARQALNTNVIIGTPQWPIFYNITGTTMEVAPYPTSVTTPGAGQPILDKDGNPILDTNGNPILDSSPPGAPSSGFSVQLTYFQRQTLGPDDSAVVPTLAPRWSVWVHATLAATAPFLRDDDRIQMWAGIYANFRDGANLAYERSKMTGRLVQRRRGYG
jgi:hypothetical protein